jgi:hypothetical protein
MRIVSAAVFAALLASATPAAATKVLILTDPMTLERRTVVIDDKGPNRYFLCAMPPAMSGCREITPGRR